MKYHKKVGWVVMGFTYAVAAIALFHFSRKEHKVRHDCEKLSKIRIEQREVKAVHGELKNQLRETRDRFIAEQRQVSRIAGSSISYKTSSALLENFPGISWPLATFSPLSGDFTKKGFLSFPDDSTQLVVYLRRSETYPRKLDTTERIISVLTNFDNRVTVDVTPKKLHHFGLPVSQQDTGFQLNLHLSNTDESNEIKLGDLSAEFEYKGYDTPYPTGFFKPGEYPILYGYPDFSKPDFLKILQARGIWLVAGNYTFLVKNRSYENSPCLQVILTCETEGPWRVHPDYLYARSLQNLQWDTEAQNYIVGPDSIHDKE